MVVTAEMVATVLHSAPMVVTVATEDSLRVTTPTVAAAAVVAMVPRERPVGSDSWAVPAAQVVSEARLLASAARAARAARAGKEARALPEVMVERAAKEGVGRVTRLLLWATRARMVIRATALWEELEAQEVLGGLPVPVEAGHLASVPPARPEPLGRSACEVHPAGTLLCHRPPRSPRIKQPYRLLTATEDADVALMVDADGSDVVEGPFRVAGRAFQRCGDGFTGQIVWMAVGGSWVLGA